MGFLDSFKEAMERGAEAAENYRERELAKQQESAGVKTPVPATPVDPRAPFDFVVKNEDDPFIITDDSGKEYKFRLLANGRAKLDDPSIYEGQDFKKITKDSIRDAVEEQIKQPGFINPADVKTIMLASNRLVPVVTAALKEKKITVMFKMLNVTPIKEG